MRLYTQSRNSAGERVRIALHLKGIDYDYVSIPALPRGDYRRINPQGLMPALEIDGTVIAQSTAILEFLEETHPSPPLLPADPVERAQVRGFGQLIASDLHPLNNFRIRRYLGARLGAGEAEILAWYRHWVAVALTALEETLSRMATSAFCFGEAPGWADLHLVPQLSTARRFGCDLAPYPRLLGVEARCTELDAFRRARPEAQPDFDGEIKTVVRPM
jgi:maleylacetoacetate isomerase